MGRWVVGVSVKTDFLTHSGSSELSLDSESKLEPSVAIKPYQTKLNLTKQKSKVQENDWSKIILGPKNLVQKFLSKKSWVPKK